MRLYLVLYGGIFRQFSINNFSFINQIKFDHHWNVITLQQLNAHPRLCWRERWIFWAYVMIF